MNNVGCNERWFDQATVEQRPSAHGSSRRDKDHIYTNVRTASEIKKCIRTAVVAGSGFGICRDFN